MDHGTPPKPDRSTPRPPGRPPGVVPPPIVGAENPGEPGFALASATGVLLLAVLLLASSIGYAWPIVVDWLLIIIIAAAAGWYAWQRWEPGRWAYLLLAIGAIGGIVWDSSATTYVTREDEEDDEVESGWWEYETTYSRFMDTPLWRSVRYSDDEYKLETSGPLSRRGKPHGRWVFRDGPSLLAEFGRDPQKDQPLRESTYRVEWLWEGEEITQAEWEQRESIDAELDR